MPRSGKRKRKLGPKQSRYVEAITCDFLGIILDFRLKYDVASYLLRRSSTDWKNLQHDLYSTPSVNALGLVYRGYDPDRRITLVKEPMSPERIVEYLGSFPMDDAAVSYVFTLVEIYGDLIVEKTNKGFFARKNRFANWHHKVHGDADTDNPTVREKMASGFGEPFMVAGSDVSTDVVLEMIELKRCRNEYAHEASEDHRFEVLFEYAVHVILEIFSLLCPERSALIVYPFEERCEEIDAAKEEAEAFEELDAED